MHTIREVSSPDLNRAQLSMLRQDVHEFLSLAGTTCSEATYHRVASRMHQLNVAVLKAEEQCISRPEILEIIQPARRLQAESPFIKRLQDWPRGYPGDFETVEYICDQRNRAPEGSLGFVIESFVLATPPAQQHRNKVRWQADRIAETLALPTPRKAVLVIASGGARDVWMLPDKLRQNHTIILNDADPRALEFASARLSASAGNTLYKQGNALRIAKRLEPLAPFDLIVAGGLFDYLPNEHVEFLLKKTRPLLAHDGRLCFTNMARGNPYRVWMEYFADWTLVERTEHELRALLTSAGYSDGGIRIERDLTGLALLATALNSV